MGAKGGEGVGAGRNQRQQVKGGGMWGNVCVCVWGNKNGGRGKKIKVVVKAGR